MKNTYEVEVRAQCPVMPDDKRNAEMPGRMADRIDRINGPVAPVGRPSLEDLLA